MRQFIETVIGDRWLLIIFIGTLLLCAIGAVLFLQQRRTTDAIQTPAPMRETKSEQTQTTTIVDDESFAGSIIRYTDGGFSPRSVSFTKKDAEERMCLIKIINDSQSELLIRLGPPAEKDSRGFLYTPIPPGESLIIDPRYSGIFAEELYNRRNIAHRFTVTLDPACVE